MADGWDGSRPEAEVREHPLRGWETTVRRSFVTTGLLVMLLGR
jgi:hypothetical protein